MVLMPKRTCTRSFTQLRSASTSLQPLIDCVTAMLAHVPTDALCGQLDQLATTQQSRHGHAGSSANRHTLRSASTSLQPLSNRATAMLAHVPTDALCGQCQGQITTSSA